MVWIFIAVKNRYLNLSAVTKIHSDLKWTKTSRNKVMQPTTINSDSLQIFPYHVHNQAGFDNPFINGRGSIYLGISKMSLTLQGFKVAY